MQAIVNMIDFGMSPQEAVEAPRLWTEGAQVELEPDLSTFVNANTPLEVALTGAINAALASDNSLPIIVVSTQHLYLPLIER